VTISINFATVANSIKSLSVSGVNMLNIDQIPQSGSLVLPVVFPQPNGWLDNVNPIAQSLGSNGTEKMDFSYTLHYVFLYAEAGSGISQTDPIAPMLAKLELIVETILNNDAITGLVDMRLNGIEGVGRIQDVSGNDYWGALFSLRCMEFAQ